MIEENKQEQNEQEQNGLKTTIFDVWNMVLLHWPWVILSVLLTLSCAYVYLRYQNPTYAATAKILIKNDNNKSNRGSAGQLNMANLGIISNTDGFENELEILQSTSIAKDAIKALDLNIRYFVHGRLTERELYKSSPYIVTMNDDDNEKLEHSIVLDITPKGKGIQVESYIGQKKGSDAPTHTYQIQSLPDSIKTSMGTIHFARDYEKPGVPVKVVIEPFPMTVRRYCTNLTAAPSSKTTTVAVLTIIDNDKARAVDYIDQLMTSYNDDANADKNEVATKTKEFVDARIEDIGRELNSTEVDLEQFKKNNNLINLTNDATTALTSSTSYQKEQVNMETQIMLVQSLTDYVKNPDNHFQVIPAGLGINDATLNQQIRTYNETLLQYNRLLKSGGENNPTIAKLSNDLENYHDAILQSLQNVTADLRIQKQSIDNQYNLFTQKIASTPTHERILNDIGRQQEIKAELFLTLLQKREENLISLASTATKAKWLDHPEIKGQVSPRVQIIWLIALALGLAIPLGIFYLMEFLRFRIEGRADVELLTKLPLLADIPHSHSLDGKKRSIVVIENSNSTMEESFRGLRTNLRFMMDNGENVILCTSTIPGEGKTFVCSNLAMSFALLGKKVIIVGLDIRKPQLVRLFDLPSDKRGITNFLADETADFSYLEEQIFRGVQNPNLDVMPAGIIPPNPGELISRGRLDEAINYLRTKYDIVMLDTPPIGLVSDTIEVGRCANVTLYVCRADYSPKTNFDLINSLDSEKKLPKMAMVLNGVDLDKRKYGYYYGYGKYGKYGYHKYGKYGHYGHYGHYGMGGKYGTYYGSYGNSYGYYGKAGNKPSKAHVEK